MADQRRWFKLWTSAATDPHLGSLPLEDFARWVKLGLYMAEHGTSGTVVISVPENGHKCPLSNVLELDTFEDVERRIKTLPNVDVTPRYGEPVTVSITIRNWAKYQEDTTWERMRRYRANRVTAKRRGDERRRDETRGDDKKAPPNAPPRGASNASLRASAQELLDFLNHKAGRNFQPNTNLDLIVARLRDGATPDQCRAIIGRKASQWKGTDMAMYLRPQTLFNKTKFAQYLGELPSTAFDPDPDQGERDA